MRRAACCGFVFMAMWAMLPLVAAPAASAAAKPYRAATTVAEAIARIEELGGTVRRASIKDDSLEVDFQHCGANFADSHLQYLLPLGKVAVLRLKNTAVTDAGVAHLAKLSSLRRLHLDKTAVTDAGLRHLVGLKELELLNLYGTAIGDAGLETLRALPKLKQLYLTDTKVSAAAIARWKTNAPTIRIWPDPERERQQSQIILKTAEATLAVAEARLVEAEKEARELAPKAEQIKQEFESAKKKADATKKPAEEARKKFDEAKQKADAALKTAQGNPNDAGLKEAAEEARRQSEVLAQSHEKIKKENDANQSAVKEAGQRFNKSSNAKRNAEDAQQAVESARQQVRDAQQWNRGRLSAAPVSSR